MKKGAKKKKKEEEKTREESLCNPHRRIYVSSLSHVAHVTCISNSA